jgi:hypothetical protein
MQASTPTNVMAGCESTEQEINCMAILSAAPTSLVWEVMGEERGRKG